MPRILSLLAGIAVLVSFISIGADQVDADPGRQCGAIFCLEDGKNQGPGSVQAVDWVASGFQDTVAIGGLTQPAAVAFASDGRVFVAEKSGIIKVFDSLTDNSATVFADLTRSVQNYWDRGMLGIALHPNFPTTPYVYVAYALDAPIGGTPPVWNDGCSNQPTTNGCVVSGRLSRLTATGNVMQAGSERVLVNDWCQQHPSHSIGHLQFGPDGYLYMSGGDGAAFNNILDYGQMGAPPNPCGDPPAAAGTANTATASMGGALRSLSPRRPSSRPRTLDGTIIRVSATNGNGAPGNPYASSSNANARRILAYGLRNPFRFTFRPGTNELWLGDVDWFLHEEINYIPNVTSGTARNFGWPCYHGPERQPGFDSLNNTMCESLYSAGNATMPYFTYQHSTEVTPGDGCGANRSAVTSVAFYNTGNYPAQYQGALFFGDYARNCIWVMYPGADGRPNPATLSPFLHGEQNAIQDGGGPTQIVTGPDGDLFWVDYDGGAIHRIRYFATNQPPTAVASASTTSGPAPLTVGFTGSASHDPDAGDTLTYAWDLDGDSQFDDSTAANPTNTYTAAGNYTVRLRVTDSGGLSNTSAPIGISAGNTPPTPNMQVTQPPGGWSVGDVISFQGGASDMQDGSVASSGLVWKLIIHHCGTPTVCHQHQVQEFGGASGSFVAPDHEYPSYIEVVLTATDSGGLQTSASTVLQPQTVTLTFETVPSGLQIAVGGASLTTPASVTLIRNSATTVTAVSPQTLNGVQYTFDHWSDGGAASRPITGDASRTYTATYTTTTLPTPSFSLPALTRVRDVAVTWSNNAAITRYLMSETSTTPTSTDSRWVTTAPSTFTLSTGSGTKRVYAWGSTASGVVVSAGNRDVVLDMTLPTATLTGPPATAVRNINITAGGSDANGVNGFYLSTSSTAPSPGAAGWTATAPTTFQLPAGDAITRLYLWTRDTAGNVSNAATLDVTLDTRAPVNTVTYPLPQTYTSVQRIDGTTADPAPSSGLLPVLYAIRRDADCTWFDPTVNALVAGTCAQPRWYFAGGTTTWGGVFGSVNANGSYTLYIRSLDTLFNTSQPYTLPTANVVFTVQQAPGQPPPAHRR